MVPPRHRSADPLIEHVGAMAVEKHLSAIRNKRERLATAAALQRRRAASAPRADPQHLTPRAPAASAGNPQTQETTMKNPQMSFGEFAQGVRNAITHRGPVDARVIAAAAPVPNQEGVGSDGGYLVPPDVRADVARLVLGEESLLGRTSRTTTSKYEVTIPADALAPWSTTGPKPVIEGEGHLLAPSKIAAQSRIVRLHKLSAFIPATDELLEDAPALDAYLRAMVPARMAFHVDDWLINGDGVAKPLGFMNSAAKLTQAKEGAQAAATINLANTQKMLTRLPAAARPTAVWLAHPETEPQLSALGFPHWNPVGPTPMLHGLPVLFREACAPLGNEGDLLLVDPLAYFSATRDPPIREDISMHLWFDAGISAFRFTFRVGGMPLWAAPITRYRTATTISTVVSLETRE